MVERLSLALQGQTPAESHIEPRLNDRQGTILQRQGLRLLPLVSGRFMTWVIAMMEIR
jgi:hypothetical protein